MPASAVPAPLREIGFDQNLDQPVPLDTEFIDEAGRNVRLGDYFGKRPVVMVFAYYDCPMLCTQVINGLASALDVLSLEPGNDFEIVTVSFDPRDTPATASAKKAVLPPALSSQPGAAAGVALPHRGSAARSTRLTKAAGFRYVWDDETQQFAHPTGVIVLTPDGRLARYLFGIEYGPRDLRYAIVEASGGQSRKRRSMRCSSTAITTTRRPDVTVWRSCAPSASRALAHRARARLVHRRHGAQGKAPETQIPEAREPVHHVSRHSAVSRKRVRRWPRRVDALYFFLLADRAFLLRC